MVLPCTRTESIYHYNIRYSYHCHTSRRPQTCGNFLFVLRSDVLLQILQFFLIVDDSESDTENVLSSNWRELGSAWKTENILFFKQS